MKKTYVDLFDNVTSEEFLLYSWLDLKKKSEYFVSFSSIKYLKPINNIWFKKFSFLIRKNKFNYTSNKLVKLNGFNLTKSFIKISRFSILQNAIIIGLIPFFENYYNSKNKSIIECLRIFIKLINLKSLLIF